MLIYERSFESFVRPGEEPPRSLTSAVFFRLRSEILTGALVAGQPLRAAELSARLRVSLTAVREALGRLLADGFVTSVDQKGFRVTPLGADELEDVTTTRIQIESLAIRQAIARGDDQWRARIEASIRRLSAIPMRRSDHPSITNEAWSEEHERFHLSLLDACGSPWLLRFRGTLFAQSERYRRMAAKATSEASRGVGSEHQEIAEATLQGDVEAAVCLLADHYRQTMELARKVLQERGC